MNKKFLALVLVILIFVSALAAYFLWPDQSKQLALIPLDSRPCNTQYPQLLGKMGNLDVHLPSAGLDNYLEKANTEELWNWLSSQAAEMDDLVINTTELFNGGLIESRNPRSYAQLSGNLERLEQFCRDNPDHEITVITILPRLLPSQFTDLWDYKDELSQYAGDLDEALVKKQDLPSKDHIPENILNGYLSVYDNAHILTSGLIELTEKGLIDNYIIGQDDAAEFGLSNTLVRDLQENHVEAFEDKVHLVYGADELTMLALTKFHLGEVKEPEDFKLAYANEALREDYLPFEAITTEEIMENKMEFLLANSDVSSRVSSNINNMNNYDISKTGETKAESEAEEKQGNQGQGTKKTERAGEAENIEIIYNDVDKRDFVLEAVRGNSAYLGVMDVSFTNRGDVGLYQALKEENLLKAVDGYAGWNTGSNTIGTELSHFYFYQYLEDNYKRFTKEAKEDALEAYLAFKYVRYAEDFIYQGLLQAELQELLEAQGIDPTELEEHRAETEQVLQELFKPYKEELTQQLVGEYQIGKISFEVEDINAKISLPWERIFEARVDVGVDLK